MFLSWNVNDIYIPISIYNYLQYAIRIIFVLYFIFLLIELIFHYIIFLFWYIQFNYIVKGMII